MVVSITIEITSLTDGESNRECIDVVVDSDSEGYKMLQSALDQIWRDAEELDEQEPG